MNGHNVPISNEVEYTYEAISKLVNKMGREKEIADLFFEYLKMDHPTLQQGFWRVIWILMQRYAQLPSNFFDLRNEASSKLCRKAVESIQDAHLPFI